MKLMLAALTGLALVIGGLPQASSGVTITLVRWPFT